MFIDYEYRGVKAITSSDLDDCIDKLFAEIETLRHEQNKAGRETRALREQLEVYQGMVGTVEASGPYVTTTSVVPAAETVDGFTRTLYFYARGPNDPPGNQWIWMCDQCGQVREKGHAPDCPHAALASPSAVEIHDSETRAIREALTEARNWLRAFSEPMMSTPSEEALVAEAHTMAARLDAALASPSGADGK